MSDDARRSGEPDADSQQEPDDLYQLRVGAHELVDCLYAFLYFSQDWADLGAAVPLHEVATLPEKDAENWVAKHGMPIEEAKNSLYGVVAKSTGLVNDLMEAHGDFEAKLEPLKEELAEIYGDLPTISGFEGRSYCVALGSFAWHVITETFEGIKRFTPDSEWDNEVGDAYHGFTPSNWHPSFVRLWEMLNSHVEIEANIHERVEREFDHAWRIRNESHGLKEADKEEKNPRKMPDNPDVRDLCAVLQKNWDKIAAKEKTEIGVAREFASQNERKAQSLLRQARRFGHLWKGADK